MKALRVDANRNLQLADVPAPAAPPPGYVTVRIAAAAINHGDKTFLKSPNAIGRAMGTRLEAVWGASAAGVVTQVGEGVPAHYRDRTVAIYRSLQSDRPQLGLWGDQAQVHHLTCLPLPAGLDALDYSGSLVNVVTAYAFLEQAQAEGHAGVLVTAGGSATGRALAVLARQRGMATLTLVRDAAAKMAATRAGIEAVIATDQPDFLAKLEEQALALKTTAVFEGVGGSLVGTILGALPPRACIYFYGFLSGTEPVSFHSAIFMAKDCTMRRFSNFETPTVRDDQSLAKMLVALEGCIEHPLFRTQVGQAFPLAQFEAAMGYPAGSKKAVLVP